MTAWSGFAGRAGLPARAAAMLAAGRRADRVRRLRPSDLGDGEYDLRLDADAADRVASRLLAVRHRQGRDLRPASAASAGDQLLPHAVGDAAPGAVSAGPAGPGPAGWRGGGGRDVHRREEPGLRGGRQRAKKVLTGIAVEVFEPKGIGRCRMTVLAGASAESLHPFVTGAVEPGSRVITDGWNGYHGPGGPALRPRAAQPACRPRPRGRPRRAAARRPPGRLLVQAVAAARPAPPPAPSQPPFQDFTARAGKITRNDNSSPIVRKHQHTGNRAGKSAKPGPRPHPGCRTRPASQGTQRLLITEMPRATRP